jgi:DNA-binding NtrC family response regulator
LYVPVTCDPALRDAWAVNLSLSGIGLWASLGAASEVPREGEPMAVQLALPDATDALRLSGTVTWCTQTPGSLDGEPHLSLGLRFGDLGATERLALAQYFHSYRPHVVVALAGTEEAAQVAAAVADQVHLHGAHTLAELDELLARGDIAVVIVGGDDRSAARAAVEHLAPADREEPGVGPAADLSPRVVYAAPSDPAFLVDAFNRGAVYRAVARPAEPAALATAVQRACADHGVRTEQLRAALALERRILREQGRDAGTRARGPALVYESRSMETLVHAVRQVAPHKVGVLLQGETGTGKELVARLIHELSGRASLPFVAQDCGALSEALLESELFGHVRGAFTGAVAAHPGLFLLADGGTILLDEIENTSPGLQTKLLRVIESGEVRPVGGARVRRVDVRVIAASNRDLSREVGAGRFRADLFFRLAAFPLTVPSLRERREDILPLARHFLATAAVALGRPTPELAAATVRALLDYAWPGNVRELKHAVERALLLAEPGAPIAAALLPDAVCGGRGTEVELDGIAEGGPLRQRLRQVEREIIRRALERCGGVVRRAARELSLNPVTLGRRARRLGLLR